MEKIKNKKGEKPKALIMAIIPLGDCKRHTPIGEWGEGIKE